MLPDPYGSDIDHSFYMGRAWREEDDLDTLWQRQQDEQEHDFWCSTEPPADDLFEVLWREDAA